MSGGFSPYRPSTQTFAFYADAHRAAVVVLTADGLISADHGRDIAAGLRSVLDEHESPGSAVSNDYLDLEARLVHRIGPQASALHLGRSRQDLLSAANRHALREGLLEVMAELSVVRGALLDLADRHRSTVVPRYTHGVPAQPTSFGHYLLAFAEAFARVDDELVRGYHAVNRSPLGAAVLATSRFVVDRRRLAELLGFEGIVENSYGANHVAPIDAIHSALAPLTVLALHVSALVQDVSAELPVARPWLKIADPELIGESSAMPQKRNPLVLENLRETVAVVLGAAHTFTLLAHNVTSGMTDSRDRVDLYPATEASGMLRSLAAMLASVEIDVEGALRAAGSDYSTMTDLADVLYERYGVPFRLGHRIASVLTDTGREQRLTPPDIPRATVDAVVRDTVGPGVSLTDSDMREVLSPADFVASRRGEGGPSPVEVARMLTEHRQLLSAHTDRRLDLLEARARAASLLSDEFSALAGERTDTSDERNPDEPPL